MKRHLARSKRMIVQFVSLVATAALGISLSSGIAFADGTSPLTVQAPTQVGTTSAPTVNTQATGSVSANVTVPVNVQVSGSTVSASTPANTPPVTVPGQTGTSAVSVTVSAPTQAAAVTPSQATNPGSSVASVVAPTTAQAVTAPTIQTHAAAGNVQVNNTTTAPTGASASTCPLVGVGVRGSGCANSGSATAVVFAPSTAQVNSVPSTTTQASAGNIHANNTTTAPTTGAVNTCPLVGVGVRGYGCNNPGSAAAVVSAPTNLQAVTAPVATTHASVGTVNAQNTTTAPAGAAATTCPVAGLDVHGYGCGHSGSAGVVAFAPTQAQIAAVPSALTQASIGNLHLNNATTAPTMAGLNTCPLIGVGVRGYGCGNPGSALGVVFAPTNGHLDTTPAAATQLGAGNAQLNNTTTVPAAADIATCPLIGVGVRGYGCGNPGSALGVIFAPTNGQVSTGPAATTQLGAGNLNLNNTTTAPTAADLATCPLIGVGVRGYGCGNPGSALGVIFAPTSGHLGTTPGTSTQLGAGNVQANNTTVVPTTADLATCPLIGIAVRGYGCGNPGSALGVIFAPTNGQLTTGPAATTQLGAGNLNLSNSTAAPTAATLATCPLIGIAVHGYGCGTTGSALGVIFAPTSGQLTTAPTSATSATLGNTTLQNTTSVPTGVGVVTCPLIGVAVHGYGCGNPGSATGVVFVPTSGTITTTPVTSTTLTNGTTTLGSTTSVPTTISFETCPLIGVGVHGYGCGSPGGTGGGSGGGTGGGSGGGSGGGTGGGSGGGSGGGTGGGSGGGTGGGSGGGSGGGTGGGLGGGSGSGTGSGTGSDIDNTSRTFTGTGTFTTIAPVLGSLGSPTLLSPGGVAVLGTGATNTGAGPGTTITVVNTPPNVVTILGPAPIHSGTGQQRGPVTIPVTTNHPGQSAQRHHRPAARSGTHSQARSRTNNGGAPRTGNPGVTRLPVTGGGRPVAPMLPLLPILIATLLMGIGMLTRKHAFMVQ